MIIGSGIKRSAAQTPRGYMGSDLAGRAQSAASDAAGKIQDASGKLQDMASQTGKQVSDAAAKTYQQG